MLSQSALFSPTGIRSFFFNRITMVNIQYYNPATKEFIIPKSYPDTHMIMYSRYSDKNGESLFTGSLIHRDYDDYTTQIIWEDDCIGCYIADQFITLREIAGDIDILHDWNYVGCIYAQKE